MNAINIKLIKKIIKLTLLKLKKYKEIENKVMKIKILKGFNINQRILDR
tara:strand:- start:679 stop:825 length:147 start_codon:yes stop_codon:yes gene_type:complete